MIVTDLAEAGRLVRVESPVDPVHELAGVAARLEGDGAAVLFTNVRGHAAPVLAGLYWNRALLAELLAQPERTLSGYVAGRIASWQADPVPPVVVDATDAPVRQVTPPRVDLTTIPVPTHALGDAGPYLDAAVVIARHPTTGVRNASIQRFLVVGPDRLHINIDLGRHLGAYLDAAHRSGRPLRFSVNIGVGPGLHFAAATPAEAAPIDTDELGIASAFHDAPVRLTPGLAADVECAADAQWALECEIHPGEVGTEGPFAEVTGLYAEVGQRPVVRVTAVHHRANPIFHTILSGREVWNSVGLLGEANVLATVSRQVPGVRDVYFAHGGAGFYEAVVSIDQRRPGMAKQAILATFAAFPPLKIVKVVDADVDIRDAEDVNWAMAQRMDAATGVLTVPYAAGHELNPTFRGGTGTKIGFDATRPVPHEPGHDRIRYAEVDLAGYVLTRRPAGQPAPVAAAPGPDLAAAPR